MEPSAPTCCSHDRKRLCFTHFLLSLTEESVFKVAMVTERGVGEQRDAPAIQTGCCCCCFPGSRANSADGIIHTATWMHLDGRPPQAVRRAPGYLRFPKEFPEHAAGEGDTPPFFFFLFFLPVCRCALCLQLSKSYPNHLVPPASLSWLSYHKWLHKETRFLPWNSFWSSLWWQLCFGWMGGSRGLWDPCLMEMTNPDAHRCVEKHMEFPSYKYFLFHARFVNARGICVASVTDNSALLQEAEPHQIRVFISPRRRPVRVPCQCTSFIKYSPAPHIFDRSFMWKVTRRLQRGRCLNLFSSSHSSRGLDLV